LGKHTAATHKRKGNHRLPQSGTACIAKELRSELRHTWLYVVDYREFFMATKNMKSHKILVRRILHERHLLTFSRIFVFFVAGTVLSPAIIVFSAR
jgi:hypothetical protein